ncbi:MAG: SH3 domain-containing protein [Acidimicrobiia bacterium]|jgi:hypothetical protein
MQRTTLRRWRLAAAGLACVMLGAACGGSGTPTSTTGAGSTTAPADTTTTTAPEATTTTVPGETTTTAPPEATTTTVPAETTTTLPGEPIDLFWHEGDILGVVGVAHDDVLNVRAGPGVSFDIVTTLDPITDDVVATGHTRQLTSSFWTQIEAGGITGWVNVAYLAYLGATVDDTAATVGLLGEIPTAETMVDLGTSIAEAHASTDVESDIVLSVAPTVGDLGEVTYDVVGLADDAEYGVRLHVFATPDDSGEGFTLATVELTPLCGRGVSADGLCL